MAYRKVDMIELKEILLRIADGQSKRQVRKVMGIDGITLNGYLDIAKELGVDITGLTRDKITDELVASIKSKVTTVSSNLIIPRDRLLLPHKDEIEGYLKGNMSRSKIVRMLEREDVSVSKSSLHRFIKSQLGSYVTGNITVRLPESQPDHYAQADFGKPGKLWDAATKRERIAWAFIVTLVFSRHMHVYITFSQDLAALIEGCEAAWSYFGGVALILIVDNMSPAVDSPDKYNPKINKLFLEYAQARGFMIDPTNIGHAKGKPHVERMVPYVRNDLFIGENFISREDYQERAVDWCSHIAGIRIHGTTRKMPVEVFEEIEKDKLQAYDGNRYDTPCWGGMQGPPGSSHII